MSLKKIGLIILTATFAMPVLAITVDRYHAPDVKLTSQQGQSTQVSKTTEDWESTFKVKATPVKGRGVASEPDAPETMQSMSARSPSSVDESTGSIYEIKDTDASRTPNFWKYKTEF